MELLTVTVVGDMWKIACDRGNLENKLDRGWGRRE